MLVCLISDEVHADVGLTWVHLPVVSNAIGIDDALKAIGELAGFVVGGWRLFGLHSV